MIASRKAAVLVLVVTSFCGSFRAGAAGSSFDIDVNELDRKPPAAGQKAPAQKPKAVKPKKAPPKPIIYSDGLARYTVQESDFRTRILAKHLHISEEELQRLMPEILRINGISNLSELALGQTLIVPLRRPQPKAPAAPAAPGAPGQGTAPAPVPAPSPGGTVPPVPTGEK